MEQKLVKKVSSETKEKKVVKKKRGRPSIKTLDDTSPEVLEMEKRLEKRIKEEVLREVMERVNPFLLTLQKASTQHLHNNAALKAKELEDGIKNRIERRTRSINKILERSFGKNEGTS